MTLTTASCPRCGASATAETSRCGRCGFVFFEEPARRRLPWPSPLLILVVSLIVAGVVATVVLLTNDAPPEPLGPVPAAPAERRLERQLGAGGPGLPGSVRCPSPIRPGHTTRCEFRYPDGDTQLMLVTVTADGRLDIDVPYPAQRRPG